MWSTSWWASAARASRADAGWSMGKRSRSLAGSRPGAVSAPRPTRRIRSGRDRAVSSCRSCLRGIRPGCQRRSPRAGIGWRGAAGISPSRRERRRCRRSRPAEARVVVQDEDRAMLRRQPPEGAIEGVPVVDRDHRIGSARSVDRQDPDAGAPAPVPAQLLVTGIDEQPMEPWTEAFRVAQPREFAPGDEECLLDGVLCPLRHRAGSDTRSRSTGRRRGRRAPRRRRRRHLALVRPASSAWAVLQRRPFGRFTHNRWSHPRKGSTVAVASRNRTTGRSLRDDRGIPSSRRQRPASPHASTRPSSRRDRRAHARSSP